MLKVLITGITGFLGSNIAESLVENNVEVIGLKRVSSDIWRCEDFKDKIDWVDIDDHGDWKISLAKKSPAIIIHGAWIGVEAAERDNWEEQLKNIEFFVSLLDLSRKVNLKKFIFLGSQAEYGNIDGIVTETHSTVPVNAYAGIKLACLEICRSFCEINNINWVWLRLFSLFGQKEGNNWLIPSVIKKMTEEVEMNFTGGEQKYAYLYVKDFSDIMLRIISEEINSGIYNISSNEVHKLRSLIELIQEYVNPDFKLNFGALPYRQNQSMHIEGDISKLAEQIGPIVFTNFNVALQSTINYYKSK